MTLEQQVANLVNATTQLTGTVNDELGAIRTENANFKSSVLTDVNARFDRVFRNSGFNIFVSPNAGSANPVDPINDESKPFDSIFNAIAFLKNSYWIGVTTIHLFPGTHVISSVIYLDHPCSIEIRGYNSELMSSSGFSQVMASCSQTTFTNKSSGLSIPGSNLNVFSTLQSSFPFKISVDPNLDAGIVVTLGSTLFIRDVLVYGNSSQPTGSGLVSTQGSNLYFSQVAIYNFVNGLFANENSLISGYDTGNNKASRLSIFFGNTVGICSISSSISFGFEKVVASGNLSEGLYIYLSTLYISSLYPGMSAIDSYGNGEDGFLFLAGSRGGGVGFVSKANGNNGFWVDGSHVELLSAFSQNNGGYGFVCGTGTIYSNSTANDTTTGNVLGKKFENNATQGFIVGIS